MKKANKNANAQCSQICHLLSNMSASWSSGNALILEAVGLRFKSWTGQIRQSVANLQWLTTAATFLQKELCFVIAMTRRWAPKTRYTL